MNLRIDDWRLCNEGYSADLSTFTDVALNIRKVRREGNETLENPQNPATGTLRLSTHHSFPFLALRGLIAYFLDAILHLIIHYDGTHPSHE